MIGNAQRPGRREAMALGCGGFAGLAWRFGRLGHFLAQEPRAPTKASACIVLWMEGGPSQIDTFDPKPGRAGGGAFGAMRTVAPGMEISNRFPRLAKLARSFSLIRSMTSTQVEHGPASSYLRTGYEEDDARRHPALGSILWHELAPEALFPGYVRIRAASDSPALSEGDSGAGFLGHRYGPFEIDDALHPREGLPDPGAGAARLSALAGDLDLSFTREHRDAGVERRARQRSIAREYSDSGFLEALSLDGEREETRSSYGAAQPGRAGAFGAGCLLARRLVERGTRLVEVTLSGWDTHADNFKSLEPLTGALDLGFSGLLIDLGRLGLLERTLVVCMGEFGRTPWINSQGGRDHYAKAFSVALAGGGIEGGRVVGKTDPDGLEIVQDPVTVPDLFATILEAAGVDPARKQQGADGGMARVTNHGRAVRQLWK